MPNIQQTHTEYAPNIYSSSQFDRIRISNIFVQKKTNIRIRIQNNRLRIFEYSNTQIYLCYTDLSEVIEYVQSREVIQSVGISNNSLLYNMGHGEDHGNHSHTDHHSVFRYCCHSLEVIDEESGDDSVEGQHDQ